MAAGPWPDGLDVRLRIGLHRGRPTLTETGYVGIAVHTAARISFAAHGGQIVMSAAVQSALADPPGDGLTLTSLGSWRFQGLPDAVELYQVGAEGLLSEFPPLRSGTAIN
jgi:class 3 adenylate cyclase